MLIKLIGATTLIVASGLYGIYSGDKIKQSIEQAKDLRMGMNLLKQEIYFGSVPMGIALENVALSMNSELRNAFLYCGNELSKQTGTSLQEYCISALCDKNILLEKECKSIFLKWASNAGNGDRKTELDLLEYTISTLDKYIEAREEWLQNK